MVVSSEAVTSRATRPPEGTLLTVYGQTQNALLLASYLQHSLEVASHLTQSALKQNKLGAGASVKPVAATASLQI
jgi:hypothetical protein